MICFYIFKIQITGGETTMQKIIYFDEGSATDILQIEYGGELISIDEEKGIVHFGGSVELVGEAGGKINLFTAIKAAFNTKINTNASKTSDSLVTKTISNTILSDFYNLRHALIDSEKINCFENFKVSPIKNSFSFMKMYTPYMKIIKEDSPLMADMRDFDIHNFDEILLSAKGYYELLAYNGEIKAIFRFNINAFKNAYSLMDLPRMGLNYYAIEVGAASEKELDIQNEMDVNRQSVRISAADVLEDEEYSGNQNEPILKIYDVILAGVEVRGN